MRPDRDAGNGAEAIVLRLSGRLDASRTQELHAALAASHASEVEFLSRRVSAATAPDTRTVPPLLLVDLGAVEFIDSAGIGLLVSIVKRARERGSDAAFFGARDGVRRAFELSRLHTVIGVFDDEVSAAEALAAGGAACDA